MFREMSHENQGFQNDTEKPVFSETSNFEEGGTCLLSLKFTHLLSKI